MKAEYLYCIHMPTIGLLYKTFAGTERNAIRSFAELDQRLSWEQALDAGYKVVKVVVVQLK